MPKVTCPACRKKIEVSLSNSVLGSQFHCPNCHALLEVVEEDPLELIEVPEEFDFEAAEEEREEW